MSTDDWAQTARQGQYRQSPEQQQAITVLKSVFDGYVKPQSGAGQIGSIYEPLLKEGFADNPVNQLWTMICEAAQILGGDHNIDGHLISFLDALSQLPDVRDTSSNPITGGELANYGVYWKDLPSFAIILREYAFDTDPDESPDQNSTRQNVATFGALCLTSGKKDIGISQHAEASLLDGIEVPHETLEQQQRASVVIPPAATWILLAGEKIYALCNTDQGRNNNQRRGYSLGRWVTWKKGFAGIAANEALEINVRDVASKAVSEMVRIEGKT